MTSYGQLLLLVLPVFALMAVGVAIRRVGWVEDSSEQSLVRIVVNLCYPCLIFEAVTGNAALRDPSNLLLPPLVGFGMTALGIGVSFYAGRWLGLGVGAGLRTFALAVGVCNYGYLPLPIMGAMFGQESQGVLMVHNVGVEIAIWTVGVLVLSGFSWREVRRRLLSPIVVTLFVAIVLNVSGWSALVPQVIKAGIRSLAVCTVPLGLLLTGVSFAQYLKEPRQFVQPRITLGACAVRLGLLPLAYLLLARYLPCSDELKQVIVIQGAMPAAVFPVIIARMYGGQPLVAVQIVLGTTALGIVAIPLWIRVGLAWVNL